MKKILILVCFMFLVATNTFAREVGLKVGDKASDFTETSYSGESITLSEHYKDGLVVLILYRGGWCYYCNLQLQEYQKHLNEFEDLGIPIIAVSVDRIEKAKKTVEDKMLGFEVVSNPSAEILEEYNAIHQVPEDLAKMYKEKYQIDLEEASGRDDHIIAHPATYVINKEGIIVFAHSDTDYKVRKAPEEILSFIRSYKLANE